MPTKRGQGRWLGRYRDAAGKEHTKMFATKGDASAWEDSQKLRVRTGDWADPQRGKVTLETFAPQWFESLTVGLNTRAHYESVYNCYIKPKWGTTRLDRIAYSDVKKWLANLDQVRTPGKQLSASRQRQVYLQFKAMLDLAVEDGRLTRNPAKSAAGSTKGMTRKGPKKGAHRYLSHEQVHALAAAVEALEGQGTHKPLVHPRSNGTMILVLGYMGLRWGEVSALKVGDVDMLRSQIHISRAFAEVNGHLILGPTKTHATRAVAMPKFLRSRVEELILDDRAPEDWLFPAPMLGPWRNGNFRRNRFDKAVKAVGVTGLTPHGLRHTAASLAVQAGANVKAVQKMLGHQSAAMTLDVYSELFSGDLQSVAEKLDNAVSALAADSVRTESNVKALKKQDSDDEKAV